MSSAHPTKLITHKLESWTRQCDNGKLSARVYIYERDGRRERDNNNINVHWLSGKKDNLLLTTLFGNNKLRSFN